MITHILTDIEGTTTAIAFVHRALFPYAASAMEGFLARHGGEAEVAAILAEVPGEDKLATLRGWMATDAKVTPLKALQGLIWNQGYARIGALRGHLWPDVAPALPGLAIARTPTSPSIPPAASRRSAALPGIPKRAIWNPSPKGFRHAHGRQARGGKLHAHRGNLGRRTGCDPLPLRCGGGARCGPHRRPRHLPTGSDRGRHEALRPPCRGERFQWRDNDFGDVTARDVMARTGLPAECRRC